MHLYNYVFFFRQNTVLVSIMHANNETGVIQVCANILVAVCTILMKNTFINIVIMIVTCIIEQPLYTIGK